MQWIVFIPVLLSSIIGLGYILMLLARIWRLPLDRPGLLNRVAQTIASGNREKALLMLEGDTHPVSILLSFILNLSVKNPKDLRHAYDYAREEIRAGMTKGTPALAWLTLLTPILTGTAWIAVPEKPSKDALTLLGTAIITEIAFWNITLFYIKAKTAGILSRADDHFQFFSGLFIKFQNEETIKKEGMNIEGLIESQEDIVDITKGLKKAGNKLKTVK